MCIFWCEGVQSTGVHQMHSNHHSELQMRKKREGLTKRVVEVENESFAPIVFSMRVESISSEH